jgi:hypothetical protein
VDTESEIWCEYHSLAVCDMYIRQDTMMYLFGSDRSIHYEYPPCDRAPKAHALSVPFGAVKHPPTLYHVIAQTRVDTRGEEYHEGVVTERIFSIHGTREGIFYRVCKKRLESENSNNYTASF